MTEAEKAYQYFVIAVPENEEQAKAYFWARKALQSTVAQPNEPERAGLYGKYTVYKNKDGSLVTDCFILRPAKDPAAVAALRAYAATTDNAELAADIINWVGAEPNEWVSVEERLPKYNIREDGELISSKILCYCETDKTVHLVVSQKFYTGRKGEIVHPVFRYYDEWGDEIENVSHWMPLPAPHDRRPPEGAV